MVLWTVSVTWGLAAALHGFLPAPTVTIGTEQGGSMLRWPILDWNSNAQGGSSLQVCAGGALQWILQLVACVVASRFSGVALLLSMVGTEAWAGSCHCEKDSSYLMMAGQLSAWIAVSTVGANLALLPKSTGKSWTF